MIFKDKKLLKKALIFYALWNLAVYAIFHLSYNLMFESYGIYIEYARLYITRAWEMFMPATAVLLTLAVYKRENKREAYLFALFIALTRLIFTLPYYYIYFISLGFDTSEALLRSALFSLGAMLLLFGAILLIVFLCRWQEKKRSASLEDGTASVSVLLAVIFPFLYFLVLELFDTVSMLVDYGASLRIGEILYMSFNYLYLAALLVVCYYTLARLSAKYKNLL